MVPKRTREADPLSVVKFPPIKILFTLLLKELTVPTVPGFHVVALDDALVDNRAATLLRALPPMFVKLPPT